MNDQCRATLLAIEDGALQDPAVAAHVASCARCARHVALLDVLAELPPTVSDESMVSAVMGSLPRAGWQLRRVAAWLPAAAGLVLAFGGLLLLGGVPGSGALASLGSLPGRAASWLGGAMLDLWAALQGSADAVAALAGVSGLWLVASVVLAALGGGWLVFATSRRHAGPPK